MGRKKIEQKLFEERLPNGMRLKEIALLLKYYGYDQDNTKGSHWTFIRGEKVKTVPTKNGRVVTKHYLGEIRQNIIECQEEANNV